MCHGAESAGPPCPQGGQGMGHRVHRGGCAPTLGRAVGGWPQGQLLSWASAGILGHVAEKL